MVYIKQAVNSTGLAVIVSLGLHKPKRSAIQQHIEHVKSLSKSTIQSWK